MLRLYQLPRVAIGFIGILAITMMFICIYILVSYKKRGVSIVKTAAIYVILLVVSDVIAYVCGSIILSRESGNELKGLPVQIPVIVVALLFSITVVLAIILWVNQADVRNNRISAKSIQEGVDLMSDGLCFASVDGTPILVNRRMHEISSKVFGESVTNVKRTKKLLGEKKYGDNISIEDNDGRLYVDIKDDRQYEFKFRNNVINNEKIEEYIAADVTELMEKIKALRENNQRLERLNAQIKEYGENIDSTVRSEEMLEAKIKLHDNLGKSLLAFRSYLKQDKGDRDKLLDIWRANISILKREAKEEASEDVFDALKKAATAVGVDLNIVGSPGDILPKRRVIVSAVHECLTNTVKHANGTRLDVVIEDLGDVKSVTITNDGDVPAKPIKEKGGLKNLRAIVENEGGKMTIESSPQFSLNIIV